jgi:hypothetical protein
MTVKELQDAVGVYKDTLDNGPQGSGSTTNQVAWLPLDIIQNTRAAFNVSVANTASNGGYTTQFGAPTGRFIAPAGYGNCLNRSVQNPNSGGLTNTECGYNNLIIHGPNYFKFDVTLLKQFRITETMNVEFRATALDVLNRPQWRVGGWNTDVSTTTQFGALNTTTFGFMGTGTAYQDVSTTNDNGGRQIDLMIRVNW